MSKNPLVTLARQRRQQQSPSQRRLWHHLRNHRLQGFGFRRQHILGAFIVDFCCVEKRLVVEIDGDAPSPAKKAQGDDARQQAMDRMGFHVIRFTAEAVQTNLEGVLQHILQALQRESPTVPSPGGERRQEAHEVRRECPPP